MNLDGFREWLLARGLRPKSVEAYLHGVQVAYERKDPVDAIRRAKSHGRRVQLRAALKQWASYLTSQAKPEGGRLMAEIMGLPRSRLQDSVPAKPLDLREWHRLLGAAKRMDPPMREVLILLIITGLRVSDVLQVRRRRIEDALEDGTLYLEQKGGLWRPFPVEDEIRRAFMDLLNHLDDQATRWKVLGDVLATSHGAAYMAVYRALKDVAVEARVDKTRVHPHLLRVTAAVQLYRRTKDILIVQKWLGHKNLTTTQRYLRYVDPDDLSGAYGALKEARA